jgi:hypothetical protein
MQKFSFGVIGFVLGIVVMIYPYGSCRQREIEYKQMLSQSEATVDMLTEHNLEQSRHELRSRMKIKKMQRSGATTEDIVAAAMHALSGTDSSPEALRESAAIIDELPPESPTTKLIKTLLSPSQRAINQP